MKKFCLFALFTVILQQKITNLLTISMEQRVIISKNLQEELAIAISECEHDKIFVLTDTTTAQCCLQVNIKTNASPLWAGFPVLGSRICQ